MAPLVRTFVPLARRNSRSASCADSRSVTVSQVRTRCPWVHLGQIEAVTAVTEAIPDASWLTVYVHTPRDVAAARIAARETGDDVSRLRAWDQTEPFADAGLVLDTAPPCNPVRRLGTSTGRYATCRRSRGVRIRSHPMLDGPQT